MDACGEAEEEAPALALLLPPLLEPAAAPFLRLSGAAADASCCLFGMMSGDEDGSVGRRCLQLLL